MNDSRASVSRPHGLGLIVPCHDEAAVIERRLANLVACAWPDGPALVVVVDDHSSDDTAQRARSFAGARVGAGPVIEVVVSDRAPGKTSAIAAGLARIEARDECDRPGLVGITDADVVVALDALLRVAAVFDDPRVGLACGAQRFVTELPDDGAPPGPSARSVGGRYDRVTAWVRRLESRAGRLFSVHGQLALWRRDLELAPTIGVAADDVDLMARVRAAGRRTLIVEGATFFESKPVRPEDRDSQARRRARAWFEALDVARERARAKRSASPLGSTVLDRAQWLAYSVLPVASARYGLAAAVALACAVVAAVWTRVGPGAAIGFLALGALAVAICGGARVLRAWMRLSAVIRSAHAHAHDHTATTHSGAMGDRWEMSRR